MDLKQKKILVTGAGGFLGSRVVAKLRARGLPDVQIVAPTREEADVRDEKTCERLVAGVHVVLHIAAVTGNSVIHRERAGEMFHDNLLMGVELMEASRRAGVEKFVGIGSVTEYPAAAPMPLKEDDLWNGQVSPVNLPYSWAKKMMLVQGMAYKAQYGFTAIHLLLTNMYGPGERLDNGFVIPTLITKILDAKKSGAASITMWGTGMPTRDFLYVDDAAEAILLAAERYEKPDPVNVSSGREVSIRELTETICRLADYKGEMIWDASKPDGDMRRIADASRAEREFGFRATTSLEEGLRNALSWYSKSAPPAT